VSHFVCVLASIGSQFVYVVHHLFLDLHLKVLDHFFSRWHFFLSSSSMPKRSNVSRIVLGIENMIVEKHTRQKRTDQYGEIGRAP
jgi:hypothetical protein